MLITKQEQEGTARLHTDVLAALHKHQGWRVSEPGFPCTFPAFPICKMGTKSPFWSLLSTRGGFFVPYAIPNLGVSA